MKIILTLCLLCLAGCDNFTIKGHSYREYERICAPYSGLDHVGWRLIDGIADIRYIKCKNGVMFEPDEIAKHFQKEAEIASLTLSYWLIWGQS